MERYPGEHNQPNPLRSAHDYSPYYSYRNEEEAADAQTYAQTDNTAAEIRQREHDLDND